MTMNRQPSNNPNFIENVTLTPTEFIKLRMAVLERDGNLDKLKQWVRGRFIKLQGSENAEAYQQLGRFNPFLRR
jgi:hypothetical protein